MARTIFVNLPVAELARSIAFYKAMGATQNPQFSDETAAAMVFSDAINVMLLTHDYFRTFTPKTIADARTSSEVLLALSAESREAVDATVEAGAGRGGRADPAPQQDHGFMYLRTLEDPDGHIWEIMWMDPAAIPAAPGAPAQ